jgi:hypothetical protein
MANAAGNQVLIPFLKKKVLLRVDVKRRDGEICQNEWKLQMRTYKIRRPTEFVDWIAYMILYAPTYPAEDGHSNASAFAIAFDALELFVERSNTDEGKRHVRECERSLRVAFELYEKGDEARGCVLIQETREMFQRCRKFINASDE